MAMFRADGGWIIERIVLNTSACWRVTRRGFLVEGGYFYAAADLERVLERNGVELADLIEDDPACE